MRTTNPYAGLVLSLAVLSGLCHAAWAAQASQNGRLDSLDSLEQTSVEARVNVQIGKELEPSYPQLSTLLSGDPSQQQGPRTQANILRTLKQILNEHRTGKPEQRAELLLAADRLAGHVFLEDRNSASVVHERQRLAADGLEFRYLELGGGWFYMHNLLWRVWKDYGKTEWREWAFVLLLEKGWDTSWVCKNGADQARPVIRQGEQFLAARPSSPRRLEVTFLVAQAFETWWSIGLLPDCKNSEEPGCAEERSEQVNPSKFWDGASLARKKAIAYYKLVLRLVPGGPEGVDARARLPLLKSATDTRQRRFFCVHD